MSAYEVVRRRQPVVAVLCIALLGGLLVAAVWPKPHYAVFRRMCTAEGGITLRTDTGPVCLWSGAVIHVTPKP